MQQKLLDHPKLFLFIFVILILGLHLNVLEVSIMEARNFITAREMLTDNNWLLTTMNGEPRYQKPPLPSWIVAVFGFFFGIKNIIALRLPAVLFVAIIGVYTYLISKKLTQNIKFSLQNALILLTSFYIIGIIFEAPSDIFTHGFMLIGIFHLFCLFQNQTNAKKHSLIAGIFIGCSILSKGPVSFYALLLPFLIAYAFSYKFVINKRFITYFLLSIVLGIIIGGSWYLYVNINDNEILSAIATKETSNWSSYNVRPFYYYWSFFTQSGIWTIPAFIGLLYPYLKTRVLNLKAYKFSFYWALFAVILLSVIPEKKSRYLMPVLIPLAINTGFYIDFLIRRFKTLKDKRETIPVYFNFGLIAIIALAFPFIAYSFLSNNLSGLWTWFYLSSIVSFGIGVLIILQLRKKNINIVFNLTVLFFVSLLVLALPLQQSLKGEYYNPPTKLKSQTDANHIKVYSLYISPEMIWNFGDKVMPIEINGTLNFPKEKEFGLLTSHLNPKMLKKLQGLYDIKLVETYNLNLADLESKSYNKRLKTNYYLFKKL